MTPVAATADKRFRRAHVKPARRRGRWRAAVRPLVLGGLIVGLAVVALYRGVEVIAHARVLQIDRIVVQGNERVTSDTIVRAVEGLKGQNLMWADLDAWRTRLLASPWVNDAELRRTLPSTVEITVSERVPAMIGRLDGRLFLVDEHGFVIDQFGPRYSSFDLPIVDGLGGQNSGPAVRIDDARAVLATRVVTALRARPEIAKQVSQIDVSDAHNAHLTLTGDSVVLYVGEDQFLERIESYRQLAETLRARVEEIAYVDMRFGERVFVGPVAPARKNAMAVADGNGADRQSLRGRVRK
jgi:cell division septal protein FtsQ